jgi:outer membrane protein
LRKSLFFLFRLLLILELLMFSRSQCLRLFLGAFVALSITTSVQGQSLKEALGSAYESNPALLAKRAELRATDEGVPQALSQWRPSITASSSYGRSETTSSTRTESKLTFNPHSTNLTLSQSLYSGGKTTAAIGSAENAVLAGRAALLGAEQKVLLDAVKAYVNVYRSSAVLELRVNNEAVLKRQLEATSDRFQVGEITRTDVNQAEARLAKTTADRIQAEGDLVSARATYQNVIGEVPVNLSSPTMALDLPSSAEETIKLALAQNPDVVSAEYNQRASQNNINSVKSELLPSLDLSGTASRSLNASGQKTSLETYSGKVTVSIPLYNSGSVYSRLRSARQTASKRLREIDAARRKITESATRAWQTLQTSRARIDSINVQIKASEVALEGVQREASVGSRTVLDVLDAEQELLDAKVSIVTAKRDETIAKFELKSAIGEMTATQLALPVTAYDSLKHYNDVRLKLFGGSIGKTE